MMRRAAAFLIFAGFSGLPALAGEAPARIEVCPTCATTRIGDAVAAVRSGGTVSVGPGVYREETVSITRPMTLVGRGWPEIDAQGKRQAVVIYKSNDVRIQGFLIRDTGTSHLAELAGIRVVDSKDCFIEGNRFLNTTYGIYLERSETCTVSGNTMRSNAVDETTSGNGVHVWTGRAHRIENNVIEGHRDGIYLEFAKETSVISNRSNRNVRYGLHFMFSHETSYRGNEFGGNGSGVAVMYSRNIEMRDNHFHHNTGTAAYGLLLKEIFDSRVEGNRFEDNTVGVFMEGSNRLKFNANRFASNGWALRLMADCEGSEFEGNAFVGNSFEVTTNGSRSWNTFRRNYWSRYDGFDLDGDGLGDRPHRPVSLSSVILERVDSSYVLLGSTLFQVLDAVEQALPALIPEPLRDDEPLMRAIDRKSVRPRIAALPKEST